jgi:hypothetical protein
VLWEQEAASSNLAIPTRSEYIPILVKIVFAELWWEPSVIALNTAARNRRGHGEDCTHRGVPQERVRGYALQNAQRGLMRPVPPGAVSGSARR